MLLEHHSTQKLKHTSLVQTILYDIFSMWDLIVLHSHMYASLILRAKKYGWQDTYVFTKAMGEMMIDKMRGETPVVIIRPSVIESTCKEPFPGWMEGNR
jgi:hypothetical protein